jgi:hypothetical protein
VRVEPQTVEPQITAEYDHRGGVDPEITFRNGGPVDYLDVTVTIDRVRTYPDVLTAFSGHGPAVVFAEFPRDARRWVRVEKNLGVPGTAYLDCRCRTRDGAELTTAVVCEISIPGVRDVFSFL